ncbi:CLUMA_CG018159, isoform A [Clunio marinus]|uniref:Xylulose kinase n=1 Tax=Clunio marinus TaxID=568069 RepID=A0A1J1IYG8_9DIPT|nr:CLUMA_CG018159, isoform A [Clunio marinus]
MKYAIYFMKLKAVILNERLEILQQSEVKFDEDSSGEFGVSGGVCMGENKNEYYVNPKMWVKAVDTVLDRLIFEGADFSIVAGISGSAQQHGSVYWNKHGIDTLKDLDFDKFLYNQINEDAFAVKKSPIWMDSSTTKQCEEMEQAVGGRDEMLRITGSKAYERFTGAQIRKIFQQQPDAYHNTVRISLVSSFLASLFLNDIAPIDLSDGSGMNLLDINKRCWSQRCLAACAERLEEKLGDPVPTSTIIGTVGNFFIHRYKFNADCKVIAFTGDNCSALSGLNLDDECLAFSLGTSDTIIMSLDNPPLLEHGHVLIHPTKDEHFMGLLCFKNGSHVRDTFKKSEANDSWVKFSELLELAPHGNFGYMALHYLSHEILPFVSAGSLRWSPTDNYDNHKQKKDEKVQFPSQQIEIRALIEGQMLNRKAFALDMGFNFGGNAKIIATGGSSLNKSILKVMADVFDCPVYIKKTPESACLGAAYRARYVVYLEASKKAGDKYKSYHEFIKQFCDKDLQRVALPNGLCGEIYEPMLERYREMARAMMERQN